MHKLITISSAEMLHNLKISCQIPTLANNIAVQKIIAHTAQEVGIKINEVELQAEGDKLRLEKNLMKAEDTWTWLEKHHLSIKEFEELVYNNVLWRKLANHLFSTQVEKFFYEHKLDYLAAAIYQVIFDNKDIALEIFYSLIEEEITFPEIARVYIEEPELRRIYGYQGIQHRKDLRPEIAAAVFAAKPPQIIKPITTSKGVYLIWVEEIIQPQLDEQLREKIITELFSDWLKQQIEYLEIVPQLDVDTNLQPQEKVLQQV